jgi:murein DD-endopeptidase MepM/ murein hydrolase activator NlpD
MRSNRVDATRYTVVLVNRRTGVGRRLTLGRRLAIALTVGVFSLPVLVGLGAHWRSRAEIQSLRQSLATLRLENANYRTATGELATQVESLQGAIADLGARAKLDPASAKAMQKLPAVVKAQAMGGSATASSRRSVLATAFGSPEDTFGLLRDLLGRLEESLQSVRNDVERQQTLAAATPSIWPAHGWLTATFGDRNDPFTGEPGYHQGLDISTEKGKPVYATANGVVESAAYNGAYGNMIEIDHGFGLKTRYGHLSRFGVRGGQRVARGEVIGYVGATGRVTGAHLHYEILANGRSLNPLQLLTTPRP